jgi:hypothetical protein
MDIASELAKVMAGAILGYFTGRATKNRDIMQADLTDRAKELRELVGMVRDAAVVYWENSHETTRPGAGREINRQLHRMQKLRVHCAGAGSGYRSNYIRDLETRFFEAISGGSFEAANRASDPDRVELIRYLAEDIDFAVMGARRADLFLIPHEEIRQVYLRITRQG